MYFVFFETKLKNYLIDLAEANPKSKNNFAKRKKMKNYPKWNVKNKDFKKQSIRKDQFFHSPQIQIKIKHKPDNIS